MTEQLVGHIKSIFRYPIKSMQGESLSSAELGQFGLKGDRAFALRLSDKRVASAKRSTSLLNYYAYYDANTVMIKLPSGETVAADHPLLNKKLEALLGIPVALEKRYPEQQNFAELDAKTIFADVPMQEALEGKKRQLASDAVRYELAEGSFFDSAHLHLLTTGTLTHLDQLLEGKSKIDVHRFRPNILIESTPNLKGFIEDEWIDAQILVGDDVVIGEIWPTLRCVMTTLPQRNLSQDLSILHKIVKAHNNHLGVFARTNKAGVINVGDQVRVVKV